MAIASLGGRDLREQERISPNRRRRRQSMSLPRIIAAQQSMIRISLGITKIQSKKEYNKKYTEEEQKSNPFDDFDCDYTDLSSISKLLKVYLKYIRDAEFTNTLDDDFIVCVQHPENGYAVNDMKLTNKFFRMLSALEETFEGIYDIMLNNGLITDKITELKSQDKSSGIY